MVPNVTLRDGKHAYITGEQDDAVSWYERNASTSVNLRRDVEGWSEWSGWLEWCIRRDLHWTVTTPMSRVIGTTR